MNFFKKIIDLIFGVRLKSLKWGNMIFYPVGRVKYTESKTIFKEGNNNYCDAECTVGSIKQKCKMTEKDFNNFMELKDRYMRAGIAITSNNDVLSISAIIDGKHEFKNGCVNVVLTGKIRKQ